MKPEAKRLSLAYIGERSTSRKPSVVSNIMLLPRFKVNQVRLEKLFLLCCVAEAIVLILSCLQGQKEIITLSKRRLAAATISLADISRDSLMNNSRC